MFFGLVIQVFMFWLCVFILAGSGLLCIRQIQPGHAMIIRLFVHYDLEFHINTL